jgi:hypothetical protein
MLNVEKMFFTTSPVSNLKRSSRMATKPFYGQ